MPPLVKKEKGSKTATPARGRGRGRGKQTGDCIVDGSRYKDISSFAKKRAKPDVALDVDDTFNQEDVCIQISQT